jgi:hypothetical protein
MTTKHVASDAASEAAREAVPSPAKWTEELVEHWPSINRPGHCCCGTWVGEAGPTYPDLHMEHVASIVWGAIDDRLRGVIAAAYAVDAPDDTDLATRVLALADRWERLRFVSANAVDELRALVSEATGPTLHDRIEAAVCSCTPEFVEFHGDHQADCPALKARAALAHDTGEPQ